MTEGKRFSSHLGFKQKRFGSHCQGFEREEEREREKEREMVIRLQFDCILSNALITLTPEYSESQLYRYSLSIDIKKTRQAKKKKKKIGRAAGRERVLAIV